MLAFRWLSVKSKRSTNRPCKSRRSYYRPQFEELDRRALLSAGSLTAALPVNSAIFADAAVQQMPSIAVNPSNPNHLVVAYMDYSLLDTGYAGIGVAVSEDGGQNWERKSLPLPDGFDEENNPSVGAANPIVRFGDQNRVFISFTAASFQEGRPPLTNPDFWNPERGPEGGIDRQDGFLSTNGIFVARSDDGGMHWNTPSVVVLNTYDETNPVRFELLPDLAIDTFKQLRSGEDNPNYGNIYVSWTRLYAPGQLPGNPDSTGGSDVMIAISVIDDEKSWSHGDSWEVQLKDPSDLNLAPEAIERHAMEPITVIQDPVNSDAPSGWGAVDQPHITVGVDGHVYVAHFGAGNFSVHHSSDGGKSFTSPNHTTDEGLAFGNRFETHAFEGTLFGLKFRINPLRHIIADPHRPGHLYALDVVPAFDAQGVAVDATNLIFARSSDYGVTWQSKFQVGPDSNVPFINDDNDGQIPKGDKETEVTAGQALPRVAMDRNGNLAIIWYDTRTDPANKKLAVFGAISTDGGATFSPNFRITDVPLDSNAGHFTDATNRKNFYLGDTIGLVIAENTVYAAWTDTRNGTTADNGGNQDIFFAHFTLQALPEAPSDRFEPNNDLSAATDLGDEVQITLPKMSLSGIDEDWFRVRAAASGTLTISALADTGTGVQLELFDESGSELAQGLSIAGGQQILFTTSAKESFFIRVKLDASAQSSSLRYALKVQSLTEDLHTRVYGSTNGALRPGEDAYYLLTAGAAGSMELDLTPGLVLHEGLKFEVFDTATSTRLFSSGDDLPTGESVHASVPVQKGQALLLHVEVKGPFSPIKGDFTLGFSNLDQFTKPDRSSFRIPAGLGPSEIASADLNGDGVIDLVVTNAGSDTVSVLLGNKDISSRKGDGTFQAPRQFAVGAFVTPPGDLSILPSFGRAVIIDDFNGDRRPDLVVTNYASSDVSVLLGRGDGTFEPQRRFNATAAPLALAAGHFNNDLFLDLAVVDSTAEAQTTVAILLGRGDGTFQAERSFMVPTLDPFTHSAVLAADFDEDGKDDLAISGNDDSTKEVTIFLANGDADGTFRQASVLRSVRQGLALAAADLDGDDNLDLVVTGTGEGNRLIVHLGNGDGTFREQPELPTGQAPMAVAVTDFKLILDNDGTLVAIEEGDGIPDLIIANSGIARGVDTGSVPGISILPGIVDANGVRGFGDPVLWMPAKAPQALTVADFNADNVPDVAVVDRKEVFVIFGQPANVTPNDTPDKARDLGTVVHAVQSTLTIVPGHEDSYFRLTVPKEAARGSGDQVLDFSSLFEHTEGAGLAMEVLDEAGNILGGGERFRLLAKQDQVLTVHVFGVGPDGAEGAGAYTLVIDVLPQVVSVESQTLLPGVNALPGGPTTNLVITFQGDRLDPVTAVNPANYIVTWLGPDGLAGTADDQALPLAPGTAGAQPIVYDPGSNLDVVSGLFFPTAVRQTVTLTFQTALPAGSYLIELARAIQTAAFNEEETSLLAASASFTGHSLVSQVGGQITEGSRVVAADVVVPANVLGDFSIFETGTSFLTQLHDDLGALLDAGLTVLRDHPNITAVLNNQILDRFIPSLGPEGQRPVGMLVIWIDPAGLWFTDPENRSASYDLGTGHFESNLANTYVNVSFNIEVIVRPIFAGSGGRYVLHVDDVPAHVRGGAVILGIDSTEVRELTPELRSGMRTFHFDLLTSLLPESQKLGVALAQPLQEETAEDGLTATPDSPETERPLLEKLQLEVTAVVNPASRIDASGASVATVVVRRDAILTPNLFQPTQLPETLSPRRVQGTATSLLDVARGNSLPVVPLEPVSPAFSSTDMASVLPPQGDSRNHREETLATELKYSAAMAVAAIVFASGVSIPSWVGGPRTFVLGWLRP